MAEDNGAAKSVSFTALKPHLVVAPSKVEEAAEFYKAAFGAEEVKRSTYLKRKGDDQETPSVLCAELKIGGSSFIVSEQADDSAVVGGLIIRLETDDVETAIKNAEKAGASITSEIAEEEGDECCGGVVGKVKDPFGVVWTVASFGKKRCGEPQA